VRFGVQIIFNIGMYLYIRFHASLPHHVATKKFRTQPCGPCHRGSNYFEESIWESVAEGSLTWTRGLYTDIRLLLLRQQKNRCCSLRRRIWRSCAKGSSDSNAHHKLKALHTNNGANMNKLGDGRLSQDRQLWNAVLRNFYLQTSHAG